MRNLPTWSLVKCCLAFLLLLLATDASAQTETRLEYEISRVAMREGMEFQYVTALCKDGNGLLWVGTKRGLYSYDGLRLQRFDLKNVQGREIFDPYISNLELDFFNKPYLLVCTPRGTLVLDPVAKKLESDSCLGLPHDFLKQFKYLKKASSTHYWAYDGKGIYQLQMTGTDTFHGKFITNLPVQKSVIDLVPVPGKSEEAWIVLKDSLMLKWNGHHLENLLLPGEKVRNQLINPELLHWGLFKGQWVGWDIHKQLYRWNESSNQIERGFTGMSITGLVSEMIYAEEYIGTDCELKCFLHLPAGQIALGTNLGLFIVRKRPSGFMVPKHLKGKEIRGLQVDSMGNLYAGTYDGLYISKSDFSGAYKKVNLPGVWDYLPVRSDFWLITQENKGVVVGWNPKDQNYTPSYSRISGAKVQNGISICKDQRGVIWIGTYYGLLWTPDPQALDFIPWELPVNTPCPMLSFVRTIKPDPWGKGILVGCGSGIFRIVYDQLEKKYVFDPNFPNVSETPVSDIYVDKYSRIWIATKGNGIACINMQDPFLIVRWISHSNGLCNNYTCMIESSNQDSVLWISTHNGLARFNTFTEQFYNFYEDNGLPNNEFNSSAAAKAPDGTLFFGGLAGAVSFNPKNLQIQEFEHETYVSTIRYYNADVQKIQTLQQEYGKGIELPPYPEYLELQLASSEFINPTKIRFRYRMLGLSDLWSNTTGENELKFIRLAPGNYTFELQVISYDGQLGKILQLPIFVHKPFYETIWFWLLMLGFLLCVIYWMYFTRLNRLVYIQQIGQQIADDLHDDIGNKLNIIHLGTQKLARSSEKDPALKVELNKMTEISRNALRSLQNMIWSVDTKKDDLNSLITRIQDFADGYLRPLGIKVRFDLPPNIPNKNMNLQARYHFLMIYQEILTNMVKFTQSEMIEVKVQLSGATLTMSIKNTFLQEKIQEKDMPFLGKRGQSTIQRRVNRINGRLTWDTPNVHTQLVALHVPDIFKRK